MRSRHVKGWLGAGVLLAAAAVSVGGGKSDDLELGYNAARRGYWQEALHRFERAAAADPQDPRALNNLAVALEAVGRFDEARATYERGVKIAPNDDNLRRNFQAFKELKESQLNPKKETADAEAQATPTPVSES